MPFKDANAKKAYNLWYHRTHYVPVPRKLAAGNLAAVKKYRAGNPDVDRRCQLNQRLKYRVLILNHFGAICTHPKASAINCSKQLELHHVNHDGHQHRLALGMNRQCNSLKMYKFVWKVITQGPQRDRFGKLWIESDFAILCRSHNASEGKGGKE